MTDRPLCPSAQPSMPGALVIGVVLGTPEEPSVSYLERPIPVGELEVEVEPELFGRVFRVAAECAAERCVHFADDACSLGERISSEVPPAVAMLPRCGIRRDCRWYAERGGAACHRCPQLVTLDQAREGNSAIAAAARPA
jgi:hypothetical protein